MSLLTPPPPLLVLVGAPLFAAKLFAVGLPLLPLLPLLLLLLAPPCETSSFRAALKRSKLETTDSASALTFCSAPRKSLAASSGFSTTFFVSSTFARVYGRDEMSWACHLLLVIVIRPFTVRHCLCLSRQSPPFRVTADMCGVWGHSVKKGAGDAFVLLLSILHAVSNRWISITWPSGEGGGGALFTLQHVGNLNLKSEISTVFQSLVSIKRASS